jgi:N-methylhydantoinase A
MERAMRVISVERGRDPRHHVLVAFGGAGPLHACRLARAIGIPKVVVPFAAGVGSAIGLLVADHKVDAGATRLVKLDGCAQIEITAILDELEERARREVAQLELGGRLSILRIAYMRYSGQGYDVRVALPNGLVDDAYEKKMCAAFYDTYRREYGFIDPDAPIETTDWYVVASLANGHSYVASSTDAAADAPGSAISGEREAYFPEFGGMTPSKIIDRYRMKPSDAFEGPCLVEERESSTVILPGDIVRVDHLGHLVIEIDRGRRNVR